jgi:hypothetical protein
MDNPFVKKKPTGPPEGQRLYEYRDRKGNVYSRGYAKNACLFRLKSCRAGSVKTLAKGEKPKNPLTLYVTATGEKVETELTDDELQCRLYNTEEAQWFKL